MRVLAFALFLAVFAANFVAVKNLYRDHLSGFSLVQRLLLIPPFGLLLWGSVVARDLVAGSSPAARSAPHVHSREMKLNPAMTAGFVAFCVAILITYAATENGVTRFVLPIVVSTLVTFVARRIVEARSSPRA